MRVLIAAYYHPKMFQALLFPELRCTIFELPVVVPETERHICHLATVAIDIREDASEIDSNSTSRVLHESTSDTTSRNAATNSKFVGKKCTYPTPEEVSSVLEGRVSIVGGSIWSSPSEWPRPSSSGTALYDTVLFSNIFHDWSMEMCATLATSAMAVLR